MNFPKLVWRRHLQPFTKQLRRVDDNYNRQLRHFSTGKMIRIEKKAEEITASKRQAAYTAVDENFPDNPRAIGIGSGSTVVFVVERIAQRLKDNAEQFNKIIFVPTGFQSKLLIREAGLRLGSIEDIVDIDVNFDGADEVDSQLNCIKGGGACLFQEKLVVANSKKFIIVADHRKQSEKLGEKWLNGVPIEVVPLSFKYVSLQLMKLGCKDPILRMGGTSKAGPVVTDNNNFIIDAKFGIVSDPSKLEADIQKIIGVVEVGLFINMAQIAYFGEKDGSISVRRRHD